MFHVSCPQLLSAAVEGTPTSSWMTLALVPLISSLFRASEYGVGGSQRFRCKAQLRYWHGDSRKIPEDLMQSNRDLIRGGVEPQKALVERRLVARVDLGD